MAIIDVNNLSKALDSFYKKIKNNFAPKEHGTHLSLGVSSSTAFRGDYGDIAYNHSLAPHAPSNAQKNSDITKAEIEAKLTGNITSHTHNYASSSSAGGAANSVKTKLIIKLNGGSTEGTNLFTFNGSTAKTVNITPSAIGAAASSHGTHLTLGTGSGNAYYGDKGKTAYDHSQTTHAPSNAQKNSDITKTEIEAKLTGAITSHSHSYIPLSGSTGITGVLRSTSEFQSTSANAFRAIYGGYGFILRNDGNDSYFLLTNKDDEHGSWNSFRPLRVENSTGNMHIGSYTNFSNNIRMGSNNTYLYGTNTAGNAVPLLRLTSANVTDVGNTSGITCLLSNGNPTYYNGSTTYTLYHTGNKPSPADIGAAAASHGTHIPTYCNDVGDWNGATYNGWFMGYGKANAPESGKWYMGFVIAHNSNYVVQTLYDFTSGGDNAANMITWQRVKYNGTWGDWKQVFNCGGGSGNYWNKNVTIGGDGVTEVGKYLDFHVSNGATTDNDGRFTLTSAGNLHWSGNLSCAGNATINGTALTISSSAPSYGGVWIQI